MCGGRVYEYLSLVVGEAGAGGHRRADANARARVSGWAVSALGAVADGSSPVRAVVHPLGFTCLPMERAGRDGVCVHLWSPRVEYLEPTTSPIHAHCWQLTSYALFGRVENRLMLVNDAAPGDGGPDIYRLLDVRSHGDTDEIRPTARLARCVPGQRQVVGSGEVYAIASGTFHTSVVRDDEEAATVVLGRMVPGVSDRCLGLPGTSGHSVRRRVCDAEQTATVARIVLDRLLAATACPA
ncbi:MAG: hypothetical protein ACRDN0_24375 [Trebonia sp.]